jgi:YfiR/HmsC-like
MDIAMRSSQTRRAGGLAIVNVALIASLLGAASVSASRGAPAVQDAVAVKAAFLYNFAKFAEWPALPPGGRILVCVVGDDGILAAFQGVAAGRDINGHGFDFSNPDAAFRWSHCHLLFIAAAAAGRLADGLTRLNHLPVLTISDAPGFATSGGMIELYLEGGRTRFAINVDTVTRSGLHLSSRLLELAKIIRDGHEE